MDKMNRATWITANIERMTTDARYAYMLASDYYCDHPAGGCLHIVLDDGNTEPDHIQFCIDYAKEQNDGAAVTLGELLLTLPQEQLELIHQTL